MLDIARENQLNLPIDKTLADRFKLLREMEKLTIRGLATETGIPRSTIGSIESGQAKTLSSELFKKISTNERFSKYALWLLDDQIDDEKANAMMAFLRERQQIDESTPDE